VPSIQDVKNTFMPTELNHSYSTSGAARTFRLGHLVNPLTQMMKHKWRTTHVLDRVLL
jgi:hypothetical protein